MANISPFLLYLFTTLVIYRNVGKFYCLSVFIWLMHTVSMACYWLKSDFLDGFENDYSVGALAIMYFTLIFLTLYLIRFEKRRVNKGICKIKAISEKKLKNITNVLILLGFYSICFFAINIPKILALDIKDVRDGRIIFYESSIFSKVAILGAFTSVFCIYFFYYYSALNIHRKRRLLLLVSSFSFILYTLNVAGRDGIVIWGLSFLAGMFLFYDFLNPKTIKKIKRLILAAAIITIPLLAYITISRFSDSSNKTAAIGSVLDYAGQTLPNLTYEIDLSNKLHKRSGEGTFPIALVRTFVVGDDTGVFDRIEDLASYGFRSNQFASYVSFFYPSYPLFFLLIFIMVFMSVISSSVKNSISVMDYASFIPAYTWSMIPIVGIFYFYYGELIGNVFLIIPFLIRRYLK